MIRLLAAIILAASPAAAQDAEKRCGLRDQMAEVLLRQYDEHPIEKVLSITGIAHEWFASPSGSWTVLMVLPDGVSCAIAAGDSKSLGPMPGLGRPM